VHKAQQKSLKHDSVNSGIRTCSDKCSANQTQDKLAAVHMDRYDCYVCKATFFTSRGLREHEHIKHKAFCCSLCNKQFAAQYALKLHCDKVHREHDSANSDVNVNSGKCSANQTHDKPTAVCMDRYYCCVCKATFLTPRGLRIHQRRKHTVYSDTLQDNSNSLEQKNTGNLGRDKRTDRMTNPDSSTESISIGQQQRNHKFCCCVCKASFLTQRGLHVHQRKKHTVRSGILQDSSSSQKQKNNGNSGICEQTNRITNSVRNAESVISDRKQIEEDNCNNRKDLKKHFLSNMSHLYKKHLPLVSNQIQEDNAMHVKLKAYHDMLMGTVSNVSTEKVSEEIQEVVADLKVIDDVKRKFKWNKQDELRLNMLNAACKTLPVPKGWFWAADKDSQQGIFNEKRMEFCMANELECKVIHCRQCKSTGILVELDQAGASVCIDCLESNDIKKSANRAKFEEAWNRVRPADDNYPKRVEIGHESEDLPALTVGECALIAVVHPVVTITRNFIANKKYKQESISLLHNSQKTWSKILPRNDLQNRFIVVERYFKDHSKKHIIANVERVKQWLHYLFQNHSEYIRMKANEELELSNDALLALERQSELAEVVHDQDAETSALEDEDGIVQMAMESGLSKTEVYTLDKYPNLYLKNKQIVRIKENGLIEVVEDDSERRPIYNVSANLCFPHLYPNAEKSPLDFGDYKLARDLLQKQTLYSHKMADGSYSWNYAEDSVYLMHQFAKLTERRVNAMVGYYISQHPEKISTPLQSVLKAFKDGMNEDGILDSQLPDLSAVMSQIPNSRQKWFSE